MDARYRRYRLCLEGRVVCVKVHMTRVVGNGRLLGRVLGRRGGKTFIRRIWRGVTRGVLVELVEVHGIRQGEGEGEGGTKGMRLGRWQQLLL